MRGRRIFHFHRFIALFTILSFSLTQAAPAFGLRVQQSPSTRASLEAGLEEVPEVSSNDLGVNLSELPLEVRESILAGQTLPPGEYFHRAADRRGFSECRVCTMRGNVFEGIPQMLHLMLTGGYDGAGIAVKAKMKGKYYIVLEKEAGHLDALLDDMLEAFEVRLKEIAAQVYGVGKDQIHFRGPLAESFEYDEAFGDLVLVMEVAGEKVHVPMEAIGHTRWATVGIPSEPENAHPFLASLPKVIMLPDGRPLEVVLAHNGNFRRFEPFYNILVSKFGAQIKGGTDSEVLAFIELCMHQAPQGGEMVSIQQATERLQRFIKYIEDWLAILAIIESDTTDVTPYRAKVIEVLKEQMVLWGRPLAPRISEEELIKQAKAFWEGPLFEEGLRKPWFFDEGEKPDLGSLLVQRAVDVKKERRESDDDHRKRLEKAQKEFLARHLEPKYSSLAIAVMNNAEEGVVVSRGRTGGDLVVYAPPLRAMADRLRGGLDKLSSDAIPTTAEAARKKWLPLLRDAREQIQGVLQLAKEKSIKVEGKFESIVEAFSKQISSLETKLDGSLGSDFDFEKEREKIVGLLTELEEIVREAAPSGDPGRRVAASEPRALAGIPGITREHPQERFQKAGRGEVDNYSLEPGHVAWIGSEVRIRNVWGKPVELPIRQMVDLANLELEGAQSRLEREIQNQATGWEHTLDQFRDGEFQDLHYDDRVLKDVTTWYFVAEGTSKNLSEAVVLIAQKYPASKINFQVVSGKEYQDLVSSRKLTMQTNGPGRVMVTFVTNTGQTETVRRGVQVTLDVNELLQKPVLMSVITNVAGSAVDNDVAKSDGDTHSVYTLVGYEMAVPATGSLNVGVMAAALLVHKVLAIQGVISQTDFGKQIDAFDDLCRRVKEILRPTSDGSLNVERRYLDKIHAIIDKGHLTELHPIVWITGWLVGKIGANEARLKFQESLREATVSGWDVIEGKHGPYAILRSGATVIAFFPNQRQFSDGFDTVLQGVEELRSRINFSARGGKQGTLIALIDEEDYGVRAARRVHELADIVVPLPKLDNHFTGFMSTMLFVQLLALYMARERFETVRKRLVDLEDEINQSGILDENLVFYTGRGKKSTITFPDSAAFLKTFSETLYEAGKEAEKDGRKVLTELMYRDPERFGVFYEEAQRSVATFTHKALEVLGKIKRLEIHTDEGTLRYAQDMESLITSQVQHVSILRESLHQALKAKGLDAQRLREQYETIDLYSLTPSEAIRFSRDPKEWRDYTETFVRWLAKQISGVESGLEEQEVENGRILQEVVDQLDAYRRMVGAASDRSPPVPSPNRVEELLGLVKDAQWNRAHQFIGSLIRELRQIRLRIGESLEGAAQRNYVDSLIYVLEGADTPISNILPIRWIYKGPQAEEEVLNDATRRSMVHPVMTMAILMHQAGAIGAFDWNSQDPSKAQQDALLEMRGYLWERWLPEQVQRVARQWDWFLTQLQGRLTLATSRMDPSVRSDLTVNWAECAKAVLTNNRGSVLSEADDTGSLIYLLVGKGVSQWGNPPRAMYADMLATHIPPSVQLRLAREDLKPAIPLEGIEGTLKQIALWNDVVDENGNPDLTKVRVVFLKDRPREAARAAVFQGLSDKEGLQVRPIQDGTFIASIHAQIPSPTGKWTQEHPLEVVWTTTHIHQAGANLLLTKAMPPGAWTSFQLFPKDGSFSPEEVTAIRAWREPYGDASPFLGGHVFNSSDIEESIRGVILPLTDVGYFEDLTRGGLQRVTPIVGGYRLHLVTVQAGSILMEPTVFSGAPWEEAIPFDPPGESLSRSTAVAGIQAKFSKDLPPKVAEELIRAYQSIQEDGEPQVFTVETEGDKPVWLVVAERPDHPGIIAAISDTFFDNHMNLGNIINGVHRRISLFAVHVQAPYDQVAPLAEPIRVELKARRQQFSRQVVEDGEGEIREHFGKQRLPSAVIDLMTQAYRAYLSAYRGGTASSSQRQFFHDVYPGDPGKSILGFIQRDSHASLVLVRSLADQKSEMMEVHTFRVAGDGDQRSVTVGVSVLNEPYQDLVEEGLIQEVDRALGRLAKREEGRGPKRRMETQVDGTSPQEAGMEEALEQVGADVVAKDTVLLEGEAIKLANGAWVDARGDGVIQIDPGVVIEPDVLLRANPGEALRVGANTRIIAGARVVGNIDIREESQIAGEVIGAKEAQTILGPGTEIVDRSAFIGSGVVLMPVRDETGKRYPVVVYGAQIGDRKKLHNNIVIWGGTDLRGSVVVRENSVLGPYAHLGPGSEGKGTVWMGASPMNDSALAHRAYGGNLIAMPLYIDPELTPLDEAWHVKLEELLAAFLFGRVVSRSVKTPAWLETPAALEWTQILQDLFGVDPTGPRVRPTEILEVEFNERRYSIPVRGVNFGDKSGSSNFKGPNEGTKAIGIIGAGTAVGVGGTVQTPVYTAPDAVVDNDALVKGLQASKPQTYVRPVAAGSAKEGEGIRSGHAAAFEGKSGGTESVRLFLAGLRTLVTRARVSMIGFRHTQDPLVKAALRMEILALYGHFNEIFAFAPKELLLLGNTLGTEEPAKQTVFWLANQAAVDRDRMTDLWNEIKQAAGVEEALSFDQIQERLEPLRVLPAHAVLALDVDGVLTKQDGDLSDETKDVLDAYPGDLLILTDIGPGQLRHRVYNRLTETTRKATIPFPLSAAEKVGHIIRQVAVEAIDRWVLAVSGKDNPQEARETVLRMEDKRKERAAGQITEESLRHGFDINRMEDGSIAAIDIELNKEWLKAQAGFRDGADPRDGWVDSLRKDMRDLGFMEEVVETLHKAGSGSMTWTPPKGQVLIQLSKEGSLHPSSVLFVDDSANNILDFPNVREWPGTIVYIGKYDEGIRELSQANARIIQIAQPGEGKPANGEEITRAIIEMETIKTTPIAGGLEGLAGIVPSAVSLGEVHIVDPDLLGVGLLASRVQEKDPVVILAADVEEERWLLNQGFVGDNRITLNVSTFGTVEAARAAAAALFSNFTPRYYRADQQGNLPIWLAGLLERYNVKDLTLKAAIAMVDALNRAYSA